MINKELAVNNEITSGKLIGMTFLILVIFMADLLSLVLQNIVIEKFLVVFIWGMGYCYIFKWTKKKDILKNLFAFNARTSFYTNFRYYNISFGEKLITL